jgi:putative hydrolase of the HAD superfamily
MTNLKYQHIFFDLDRTLWDFESNSADTFHDLLDIYELKGKIGFDDFYLAYRRHNDILWKLYREKGISKEILSWQRFYLTLDEFAIGNETMARGMGKDYLSISQTKQKLFPYTHEILAYLQKKYSLHIITNGFEEVQFNKIKNCSLNEYFTSIVTSEMAGYQKPRPEIFLHALELAKAGPSNSIMIGDDVEVDIKGAMAVGMDQIHFNYHQKCNPVLPTFQIRSLIELKDIL